MASPTPLGVHQIAPGEKYALVEDLNWVGITADAAIAMVKARAEYLTDKAVMDAADLSQRALNELPGRVVAEVDRVIGDTREDAAEARDLAERAYEYNQALVAPAADVVNAVVSDPASAARTSLDAAYVRVIEGPYDVHRAGPIGAGDDTATIKAAITAAGTGGHLRFRPGVTYMVSSTLVPLGGQTWHMDGSTLKVKPGTPSSFNAVQATTSRGPFALLGPTFDGSRDAVGWAVSESSGGAVNISATGAGWDGEYVIHDMTARDMLGNALRVQGAASSVMSAIGTDAANTPWARVRVDRITTERCRRGAWVDRAGGVDLAGVDFRSSDRDHLYQYLTRAMSVRGGRLRDAGTTGNQTGHAAVDLYGLGTIWSDMASDGASYNGFCLGGGDVSTHHTRGIQWSNLTSTNATASGFSLDPTLALPTADRPGHTLDVAASLTGLHAHDNGIHGLYLHATRNVQVTAPILWNNTGHGLAGDAYNVSVNGGAIHGNTYGIALQGLAAGYRDDGSLAGSYGKYTGYGRWFVSRQTRVYDNTATDLLIAPNTRGYPGSVFELAGAGSPEAVWTAPVGSTYLDTATGDQYVKRALDTTSIGTTRLGWKKVTTA